MFYQIYPYISVANSNITISHDQKKISHMHTIGTYARGETAFGTAPITVQSTLYLRQEYHQETLYNALNYQLSNKPHSYHNNS